MPEKDQVRFQWVVGNSDLDAYRAELLSLGAELEEVQPFEYSSDENKEHKALAIEPMFILAGVLSFGFLVELTMRVVRNLKYNGIIIDARGEELIIREHPALDQGSVVVVGRDKAHKFDSEKFAEIKDTLKDLLFGADND
jgi:hypothetical protein